MSPKQEIYREILWWTLPHIRNVSTQRWWRRLRDRSVYFESELIHNLPVSMYSPEFEDHDIWFLNVQARTYVKECSDQLSPLYRAQKERIAQLATLVPAHLAHKLQWHPDKEANKAPDPTRFARGSSER